MESAGQAFLESLWAVPDPFSLMCYHCNVLIDPKDVLARTLRMQNQQEGSATKMDLQLRKIATLEFSTELVLVSRHLECLLSSTKYVAVSHVWQRDLAELQYLRGEASVNADDVSRTIREIPALIFRSLLKSLKVEFELWHDYVSVPQWQTVLKGPILEAIPRIYNQAWITAAYLHDLDPTSISAMRRGLSVYDRCRGVSNVCNSKWFSRVWTAMELTQSRTLRIMDKNFDLVLEDATQPFVEEVIHVWWVEVKEQGKAEDVERMVGMGNNLVPWQLGPVELVRTQQMSNVRIPFAIAHELLARRCVTIPRDFLHGLLGIIKPGGLTVSQLSTNIQEALQQVAKKCLVQGDLSPLFMVPQSSQGELNEDKIRAYGYNDLDTWGLNTQQSPPVHCDVVLDSVTGNLVVPAGNMGTVRNVYEVDMRRGAKRSLAICIQLTLDVAEDNVDAFVRTLGARLYRQDPKKIFDRLHNGNHVQGLRARLSDLQCVETDLVQREAIVDWIADAMGLSNRALEARGTPLSPMQFVENHGGTLHLMHLSVHSILVNIQCRSCQGNFLSA
ncbi:hypothetical protein LTR17_004903 [Elasticomyces elasticus]|nr:hypothetical protein LTR17_004903 [Elasticomyces elasticus]